MWTEVLPPEAFLVDRSITSRSVPCGPEYVLQDRFTWTGSRIASRSVSRGSKYDFQKRFHADRSMTSRSVPHGPESEHRSGEGLSCGMQKESVKRERPTKHPTDISTDPLSDRSISCPTDRSPVRPTDRRRDRPNVRPTASWPKLYPAARGSLAPLRH